VSCGPALADPLSGGAEGGSNVEDERAKGRGQRGATCDQHEVRRRWRSGARGPICLAEAPSRPVSLYRPLHLPADGKPDSPSAAARLAQQDERWPLDPRPLPKHRLKVLAAGEPLTPTPAVGYSFAAHR
jgi:hypothetical protein